MQRIVYSATFGAIALMGAVMLWWSVVRAVTVDTASDWIVPGITASIMIVALLLAMIFVRNWWQLVIIVSIVFGSSLLIVFNGALVLSTLFATALFIFAWRAVQGNMRDYIRVRAYTHLYAGIARVTFAVALMISTVFYAAIIERDAASLMLSNSLRATFTGPIARMILPSPMKGGTGHGGAATVDDFIMKVLSDKSSNPGTNNASLEFLENYAGAVTQRLKGMVPNLANTSVIDAKSVSRVILTRARQDLGRELGMSLTGKELVADVFTQSLERQIQKYAQEKILPTGYKFSKALAGVMAFFLFLTIMWMGSLFKFVWLWSAQGIFAVLRKIGIVQISLRDVQKEEIV